MTEKSGGLLRKKSYNRRVTLQAEKPEFAARFAVKNRLVKIIEISEHQKSTSFLPSRLTSLD